MTIIQPWRKTQAEEAGFTLNQKGTLEWGTQFGAYMLRKEQAGDAMRIIGKGLWELRQAMADQSFDDEKCVVVFGVQVRNGWTQVDGEWVEEGSPQWLQRLAEKSQKTEV